MFGGWLGGTKYDNSVWLFDSRSKVWAPRLQRGPVPCGRARHSACIFRESIVIFGGFDGANCLNDMWVLDISPLCMVFSCNTNGMECSYL